MPTLSRRMDASLALAVGLPILAATLVTGDPLYAGVWYYLVAWLGLVGLVQLAKAPPLLTTGAAVALAASFLLYWGWQASLSQPDGLLGLGHLFSLPGLGIAGVIAAVVTRRRRMLGLAAFCTGLLACSVGFAITQVLVCRSLMYCGVLSGDIG